MKRSRIYRRCFSIHAHEEEKYSVCRKRIKRETKSVWYYETDSDESDLETDEETEEEPTNFLIDDYEKQIFQHFIKPQKISIQKTEKEGWMFLRKNLRCISCGWRVKTWNDSEKLIQSIKDGIEYENGNIRMFEKSLADSSNGENLFDDKYSKEGIATAEKKLKELNAQLTKYSRWGVKTKHRSNKCIYCLVWNDRMLDQFFDLI